MAYRDVEAEIDALYYMLWMMSTCAPKVAVFEYSVLGVIMMYGLCSSYLDSQLIVQDRVLSILWDIGLVSSNIIRIMLQRAS